MVSIGNFRSQQLTLGATNRNTGILKTNLQAQPEKVTLKPSGKTKFTKITQITPKRLETNYDSNNIDYKNLKPGDTITFKNKDGSIDVFYITKVYKEVVEGLEPGKAYDSMHMSHTNPNGNTTPGQNLDMSTGY